MEPRPHSRPHSLFPSQHLTSESTTVPNPVQALRAHVTYCLQSTYSHFLTHISCPLCRFHCRLFSGTADGFFFSFSLLRFIFFGWNYRPFVLGQSVPPPPHLPGGFPEKPAAELGVRRCRHSRPSAQVPALPPPPPAGLKLPSLRFPPRPHRPPHSEARPPLPKRFSNQRAEIVAVTGCRFN